MFLNKEHNTRWSLNYAVEMQGYQLNLAFIKKMFY